MADDDEDALIAEALATLEAEDRPAADDARAALEWLAGEQGLALITQERLQTFLWYDLPMKWMTDMDDKLATVEALGRALDLLGLSRYSAICRSGATGEILRAYEGSIEDGKVAFRRANAASGIQPPDLPELQWEPVMGFQEASALSSTADFLELAVAGGDLVLGARGWKSRQRELVRTYLNKPRMVLVGQTQVQVILTERIETWVNTRRSETRRKTLAATPAGSCIPLSWASRC